MVVCVLCKDEAPVRFRLGPPIVLEYRYMKKSDYIIKSLINAVGVLAYVLLIVLLMANTEKIIEPSEAKYIIPVFMLLLFIISATVTGLLVLGKPIMLYHSGQKKEGVTLLLATVGWLVVLLLIVGSIILSLQ